MAYTQDLKSCDASREGPTPSPGTDIDNQCILAYNDVLYVSYRRETKF